MSHFREPLKRRTAAVLRENNPPLGLRKKSGMDVIKNDYLKYSEFVQDGTIVCLSRAMSGISASEDVGQYMAENMGIG